MTLTNDRQIEVRIDNRARLVSAVLAATRWPDDEQARKPHGTHAHARGTRRALAEHKQHPAIRVMQVLLDKDAPLEALYTYVMSLPWPGLEAAERPRWVPPHWNEQLWHLYETSGLASWWEDEDAYWSEAKTASTTVLNGVNFYTFLEQFIGPITEHFVFIPNISYPTDTEIGVRINRTALFCVAPPRVAWGDNPPWPFDEDPAHVYRAALNEYGRLLVSAYLSQHADVVAKVSKQTLPINEQFAARYPTFHDRFVALFLVGVVGLFLEREVSEQEAKAYVLMRTKAEGLEVLPGVVSVLSRYLDGKADGRWNELHEFLPHFSKLLRVAKTITTL